MCSSDLGTEQDFEQQMIKEVGEDKNSHSFHQLDAADYVELHNEQKPKTQSKNVAVIVASGVVDPDFWQ